MNYEERVDAQVAFDKFMERLRSSKSDVVAWIELASPVAQEMGAQLSRLDEMRWWLDGFRPLTAEVVDELRHFHRVQLTFHSNALEGNTLSQSETELVLSHGVTVGGAFVGGASGSGGAPRCNGVHGGDGAG